MSKEGLVYIIRRDREVLLATPDANTAMDNMVRRIADEQTGDLEVWFNELKLADVDFSGECQNKSFVDWLTNNQS